MGVTRLAVDVGGTFVDLVLLDEASGQVVFQKEPSLVGEITDQIFRGLERLGSRPEELGRLIHGSTVVINTILQRQGAVIGLLTTEGFRDVLQLGRGNRPEVYNLLYKPPEPVVPRHLRFETPERISHRGEVIVPLDEEATWRVGRRLAERGVEAIGVCFLHAYANPAHERRAREILHDAHPDARVSIASDLTGEWREFERTSTVALNAYVMPRAQRYVGELEQRLEAAGFRGGLSFIQSTGGLVASSEVRAAPIRTLESGPAGGIIGAVALGRVIGESDLIAADVGGTSFDVGLILDGQPFEESQTFVDRRPVLQPTIDIVSVGAGGGSIAWIDDSGAIRVGPLSAEADPGPICFGRGGTRPTVTDAHVVLGRINPDNFLNHRMELDVEAARRGIEREIGEPLGLSLEEAADGIVRLADVNMIHAVRQMTIERGHDPRELALLCYGGGGGLFAASLAAELQIGRTIIPPNPSVFSAWGILNSDYREDRVLTSVAPLADLTLDEVLARFERLEQRCLERIGHSGAATGEARTLRMADMRYEGQEHTVRVPVPAVESLRSEGIDLLRRRFDELHQRTYSHASPGNPTELVNLRVTAIVPASKPILSELPARSGGRTEPARHRKVFFRGAGGWIRSPIYDRERLGRGDRIAGPAIVEEWSSTTVAHPGQTVDVDPYGNLILRTEGTS